MTKDSVRAYYASFGEREWQRLANPDDGAVEFALTKQLLARYLPPSGRILDLGGGPGRYTIWLAERGYQVVLADLSPELLAIPRTQIAAAGINQQVEAIVEADACDLSRWPDASFDAVLCLGPFYHRRSATGGGWQPDPPLYAQLLCRACPEASSATSGIESVYGYTKMYHRTQIPSDTTGKQAYTVQQIETYLRQRFC